MAIVYSDTPSQPQFPHRDAKMDNEPGSGVYPFADRTVKDLVHLFKLLADETRLKILFFLQQTDELNVLELCERLRQRQPSVSHHLALLRVAGLIEMRREGKHNYYRLLPRRFEEMMERLFDASQGQPLRVCFEDFELRYGPIGK